MSLSFARRVIWLGLFALAAGGCGGSPASPSPARETLALVGETPNYIHRASAGDTIDAAWQERYHVWATAALGVTPPRKITYNKYKSRVHMESVVGVGNANAWADRDAYAIHTISPVDNHEVVHLFTSAWGTPVALINEGMAVAFQVDPGRDLTPRWSGTPLHDLARQFRQQGRLVALAQLTETASWRSQDSNVAYPESGSFVRWLIDAHGLDRVRALYARAAGSNESAEGVRASFAAVYGLSLDELERAWLGFLGGSG